MTDVGHDGDCSATHPNADLTERALRSGEPVVTADGYRFQLRGPETDDHLALGGHEEGIRATLYELAGGSPTTSVILSVGAHVGLWAIRLSTIRPVVAYEANPLTCLTLAKNVELNAPHPPHKHWLHVRNSAVWDRSGVVVDLLDENGKREGGSTRAVPVGDSHHDFPDGVAPQRAHTVTLDEEWPDNAPYSIGLIQLDVEGAEARVLRGAQRLLERDRPTLLIEVHQGHPGTDVDLTEQLDKILTDAGYQHYPLRWQTATYWVARHANGAPKPDFEPEIIEHPQDDLTGLDAEEALREMVREDLGL